MSSTGFLAGRYVTRRRVFVQGSMAFYDAEDRARSQPVLLVEIPRVGIPESSQDNVQDAIRRAMGSRHRTTIAPFGVEGTENTLFLSFQRPPGEHATQIARGGQRQTMPWPAVRRAAADLIDQAIAARDDGEPRVESQQQLWIERTGAVHVLPFWPEALAGKDKSARTATTDKHMQHGIAMTLYELITGEPPSGRVARVDRAHSGVPRSAARAIDRALRTEPQRRFKRLEAFDRALGPRAVRSSRRFPRALIALLLLVGLTIAGGFAWPHVGPHLAAWTGIGGAEAPSDRGQADAEARRQALGPDVATARQWSGTYVGDDDPRSGRLELHANGRFVLREGAAAEGTVHGAWNGTPEDIVLRPRTNGDMAEYRGYLHSGRLSLVRGDVERRYRLDRRAGQRRRVLELMQPRNDRRGGRAGLMVTGRVADPRDTVLVEGERAPIDEQGWFAVKFDTGPDGPRDLEVVCRTEAGFVVREEREVHLDRVPPVLEASATGHKEDGRWTVLLSGRARDVAGSVRVTVDGRSVGLDERGRFQLHREADAQQSSVFEVVATDEADNRTRRVVRTPIVTARRSGIALIRQAQLAGRHGDWTEVERLIVAARGQGIEREEIPDWLMAGLQRRSVDLSVRIEAPRQGDHVDGPRVEIRGRVLGWRPGDVVVVSSQTVAMETPTFSATLHFPRFGRNTVLVELRREGEVRSSASVDITVRDRNPKARSWTQGRLKPEQEACAEKHGIPVAFENHLGMRFVLVPPGEFEMGPDGVGPATVGRKPNVRRVVITQPFYMSMHEVTNGQIRRFPDLAKHFPDRAGGQSISERNQPAVGLVHPEIRSFITWLNRGDPTPGRTYELPTEAQWEYAARAGSTDKWFPWEGGTQQAHKHANLSDTSTRHAFEKNVRGEGWERSFPGDDGFPVTAPVGRFPPSDWGLYDMIGNAAEVCRDHPEPYEGDNRVLRDPVGRLETGIRALRGGSWIHRRGGAGLAWRGSASDIHRRNFVGFRLIVPVRK